jgi:polar amino acid transport system substrate-binding protein
MLRNRFLACLAVGAVLLVACGDDDDDDTAAGAGTTSTAPGSEGSGNADCPTLTDGTLTVGTDTPAFPPWFVADDPANGQGFESAVAFAVADQLGYDAEHVSWVTVPFNNAFAPGPKDFDFDINQVSITEERDAAVDFSDGYYDVNQAVVAFTDSDAVGASTLADLQGLKLGAQVGTTSLDFITDEIQPTAEPFVYNDNAAAKAALEAHQIDAIVLDLPTAFYVSSAEIEGTAVIAQFPPTGDQPEQFGMVFEEGNPLRDCVNEALATLEDDGTLDQLEQQWLSDVVDAPVIPLG